MRFEVWVKGVHHYATPPLAFGQAEVLEADFWELIWDSAPSEFDGALYAARHYGAVVPADVTWRLIG